MKQRYVLHNWWRPAIVWMALVLPKPVVAADAVLTADTIINIAQPGLNL